MLDTRRQLKKFLNDTYTVTLRFVFTSFSISLLLALVVAFVPHYNLSEQAVLTLFILVFSAGLWITEAIPAFAVSLLIIALEIILLGFHHFDFSTGAKEWEVYLQPWSSPLVFLFLAGFIMAAAASKTKLDIWLAKKVLFFVGNKPHNIISGIIAITYVLSMFISNTATAAMMMTIVIPLLANIDRDNKFQKAILLSIVIGANLGGMATIIGTPPNAIAVGILADKAPSFVGWIGLAFVPSVIVVLILRYLILKLYPSSETFIDLDSIKEIEHFDDSTKDISNTSSIPSWKKSVTVILFALTVLLWLTGPLHHIPTTVVSLIPIIGFTLFGVLDADDMTKIRWDVIILIIGGLNLGLAVSKTGLDLYIASLISTDSLSILWVMFIFSYLVVVISNFMSNTAATNIMLPIVVAIALSISEQSTQMVAVAVALSASFAMCLPVSTPPNAIVYSSNRIVSKDFLILGIVTAAIGPVIVTGWLYFLHLFH
ncbi:DASS family sodium-coupled anion symporter [bacterium]|nr:DASS family sodium-coupled anion symporter [bacterium]MBU1884081.1 DASS family sodium-coupled anion symporter [bacterium]